MSEAQMRVDLACLFDWILKLERDEDFEWAARLECRADEIVALLVEDRSRSQAA